MTPGQPPKFATWLLQHFGSSVDNDAVLGDLAERFREGKHPAWYWKQTLVAIVVSAFEDIRHRKVLALRSLLAGCLVHMGIELLMVRFFPLVPYWVPVSWWGTGLLSRKKGDPPFLHSHSADSRSWDDRILGNRSRVLYRR